MPQDESQLSVDEELAKIYSDINSAIEDLDNEDSKESDDNESENQDNEVDGDNIGDDQEQFDEEESGETEDSDNEDQGEIDKATSRGWKPKGDWKGDPTKWVDYDEFNRRGQLTEKITSQNKVIKSLNKKLDALINHNKKLEENTREKVINELELKRKQAVKDGDTDSFDEIEKKIEEIEKEESELEIESDEPESDSDQNVEIPDFIKDFAKENSSWFEKDKEMTEYMIFKTQSLVSNRNMDLQEAIKEAGKTVKQTFKHKFANPNKSKPNKVMSNSKEARPNNISFNDLTHEQKQVWQTLKKDMTINEFLKQIEEIG